jgi:hypothetical protein
MALFERAESRRRIAGQLIYFLAWLAITAVGAFLRPSHVGHGTHEQLGLPPCPSVLIFDRPCPGCGLTTSWTALIHGDLASSFSAHALGPFLYLFFTATAVLALRGWFGCLRMNVDTPTFNRAIIVGAILFFCFGLVRMSVTTHYRAAQDIAALR